MSSRSSVLAGIGSLKGWVARSGLPHSVAITERLAGQRAVALLEYPFEPTARWGWTMPPNGAIAEVLAAGSDHYGHVLASFSPYLENFRQIPRAESPTQPSWDNDFWASLDAVRQYVALAERRPELYLEIGSGNSTLFARQAIVDHDLPTRIVSVDPAPRADIDAICDEVHREPLERVDLALFDQLQAGDVLLVDGSHTAFMGSDAVITIFEILPRLKAGVLVGFDDIFLPWDYPPQWTGRWYAEQYLLAGLLLGGAAGWKVDFPGWYLVKETSLTDQLPELWEIVGHPTGRIAMSMWLERTADGYLPGAKG